MNDSYRTLVMLVPDLVQVFRRNRIDARKELPMLPAIS